MLRMTTAAWRAVNFALMIAFAAPLAATAAAPAQPIARPPPTSKPYQPVVQNDVTGAYQYRTRILASPPSCQNFATNADAVFLSNTLDDQAKTEQLKKIGADAAAAGCLAQQ